MGRTLDTTDMRDLLQANAEHPRWDDVAERCLSCGNCTLVCPTCFCSTVEDTTDLAGVEAEHTRVWDSCFTLEHSYVSRRQRAPLGTLALPPVDDAQALDLDRPVRQLRMRRLRALHHVVPRRHRHHRGDGGDPRDRRPRERAMRTIEELVAEVGALQALAPEHRDTIAGCARNRVFEPGEQIMREGDPADAFFVVRKGAVAVETTVPGRGATTVETLHDGDLLGWSWLVPPYRDAFDARALGIDHAPRARRRLPARQVRARPERWATTLLKLLAAGLCRAAPGHAPAAARPLRDGAGRVSGSVGNHTPAPFRVTDRRRETHDTWTLKLEPCVADAGGLPPFAPGQFAMLYAFGAGEAPISVSAVSAATGSSTPSAPWARRRAPSARSRPGDVLGVRGPFGVAWPLAEAAGHDVVVIAGGIGLAPLRPVVHELLAHRARYGSVSVLIGGRSPPELLYAAEIGRWRARRDVEVEVTVDAAPADWSGRVGVVTRLIGARGVRRRGAPWR